MNNKHVEIRDKLDSRVVAGRQFGVITSQQLMACGLTRSAISRQVASGKLVPLHRGVYFVGHSNPSLQARQIGAVLVAGEGALLGYESAAVYWGWRGRRHGIDVVVPRATNDRHSFTTHGSRTLSRRDGTRRDGIPMTSFARTLLDVSDRLTKWQVANIMYRAVYHGWMDGEAVCDVLERNRGRSRACGVLRQALGLHEAGSAGTRSFLEDDYLKFILDAGVREPLVNQHVPIDDGGAIEVDFYWPELGLCVETDGPTSHSGIWNHAEDAAKQPRLERSGFTVVRFTAAQVRRRDPRLLAPLRRA